MPKKKAAAAKTAVKSSSIVMRKRKDGTIHLVSGEFPEQHEFSTRMLGRIGAEGMGRVTVELNLENGKGVYEVTGPIYANPEDPESATTGYKVRRVAGKKGK